MSCEYSGIVQWQRQQAQTLLSVRSNRIAATIYAVVAQRQEAFVLGTNQCGFESLLQHQ